MKFRNMPLLRNHSLFVAALRLKSSCAIISQSISQKLKLAEVPDVCTSEEWNIAIQIGRNMLQKHESRHRRLSNNSQTNLTPVNAVIQRLKAASYNNSHLTDTFKFLVENSCETASLIRWPGLITLMLSEGIGNPFTADNFISKSLEDAIWSTQMTLAEIINTIYCNLIFRKENWRISASKRRLDHLNTMVKVDRLMSNYFTSSCIYKLSALKNPKVIFLLSNVLETFAKTNYSSFSNFYEITNKNMWEYKTFNCQGILLANGCQAVLELSGHDDEMQERAFEFGHLFTLAIKANSDIQQFCNYQMTKSAILNLHSFPIALHLGNNPETFEYFCNHWEEMDNLQIDQLNDKLKSYSLLDEAKQHLEAYVLRTLNILQDFRNDRSNELLEHLVELVKTLNCINEK